MKTAGSFITSLLVLLALAAAGPALAQDRDYGGMGISVYGDVDFRGPIVTLRQDEPDLGRIGLNDMISSVRVGPGEQWQVCADVFFRGRCELIAGEERDLRRSGWNDTISSIRRVDGRDGVDYPDRVGPVDPSYRGGPRRGWNIAVFDQPNYRGRSSSYSGAVPNLGTRAASVTIGRGVWELCDRANYRGRCVIVENSVPDLRVQNLRGRVVSMRPVEPRTRPVPQPGGEAYITFFDQRDYRGAASTIRGMASSLSDNDRRARSATVNGIWELCDGEDFRGRCVTVDRSVPDLDIFGLGDRISSVRPVGR
ncbi:MAG: beta/gamma crystallin-related protein [Telluria sp.]